jgi:hypothetical protein
MIRADLFFVVLLASPATLAQACPVPFFCPAAEAPLAVTSRAARSGDIPDAVQKRGLDALATISPDVEGTRLPGLDGGTFFIYQAPSTLAEAGKQTLRVQRSASYPNSQGKMEGTAQAIWGLDYTSPTGSLYEWAITGQLYNQTGSALGGGAQNVAVNGTAFKQFKPGYPYGDDQIGPTWGGNFVCNDKTGTRDPNSACVGVEIDNYFNSGVGTDNNGNRVVLQLAWGSDDGTPALSTDHVSTGILIGGNGAATMDNALKFGGGGAYGIGLNFAGATFNTAAVFMGQGQKLVFDGTIAGTYNWALSDIYGTMALQFRGANKLTIDDGGNAVATGSIASAANISASGVVNAKGGFQANGVVGVSCAAGTVNLRTFTVTNGIVTHC